MDAVWLDRYLETWIRHRQAGSPDGADELVALLGFMAADVVYEDVPTVSFNGHDGVADMCTGAHSMSSDMTFEIVSRQCDGSERYAFESVGRGTNDGAMGPIPATGKSFELRGASIGTVNAAGLVQIHRDYWDLAGFLGQLGVTGA
jgi:hypothetical protein